MQPNKEVMKKLIFTIGIVVLLVGTPVGLTYWHTQEQKAWFAWKQHQLNKVDEMSQKQEIPDSLKMDQPSQCAYCYIKSLIR